MPRCIAARGIGAVELRYDASDPMVAQTLGLAVRSTVSHVRSATTERCYDERAAGRDDRRRPLGAGHLPDPRRHVDCLPGILKAPLNFGDLPLAADVVHAQPMFVVSEAEAAAIRIAYAMPYRHAVFPPRVCV